MSNSQSVFRYDVNRSGTITKDEFTAILEVNLFEKSPEVQHNSKSETAPY